MSDHNFCPRCGASWRCEHAPDEVVGGLRFVPPDGPTARQVGVELARLKGEAAGMGVLDRGTGARDAPDRGAAIMELAERLRLLASLRAGPGPGHE